MKCEIHHGGNSLKNVANLHVTMTVPNCESFEFFLYRRPGSGWSRTSTREAASSMRRPNPASATRSTGASWERLATIE